MGLLTAWQTCRARVARRAAHPLGERRHVPLVSPPIEAEDIVGNFLLGTPVGLAASLTFRRAAIAAALVTLPVSLAGEAIQIYSHERFPSATDVVCNVAGAVAAALAGSAWRRHNRPKH